MVARNSRRTSRTTPGGRAEPIVLGLCLVVGVVGSLAAVGPIARGVAQVPAAAPAAASVASAAPLIGSAADVARGAIEGTRVVARVGDHTVLAGDLLPTINRYLDEKLKTVPPEQRAMLTEDVLEQQRSMLLRQLLPNAIDTKLAYLDFLRTVPAENVAKAMDELYRKYDEEEMPRAMTRAGVKTPAELDAAMRKYGSSLDKERRIFAERLLAQVMVARNWEKDQEVSHAEMLQYYQQHIDDFSYPAKARWEHLCTLRANHPTEAAARYKLAQLGNEVLHGAPWAAVARRGSEGLTARDGGSYDWTEQGSLASKPLDEALFTLPPGRLSTIISDASGFHIIRVVERQPAGTLEFPKVQQQIVDAIREERKTRQAEEYLERLRERTPIWTAFELDLAPQGR